MTEVIIVQRMYQRRGTAAEWTTANPILQAGEIGVELYVAPTLNKFKIGDGVTAWNTLPYFTSGGAVEMQASATHIQYRPVGTPTWIDIVPLADLVGPAGEDGDDGEDGREVELQKSASHIQWRYVGDPAWTNLVPLADIVGSPGAAYARRVLELGNAGSAIVICDWSSYDEIRVTLDRNVTFVFENALDGQGCILKVKQDATGGRTVTLPASVRYNALISSYSVVATPNKADKIGFVRDAADNKYDFVSIVPGI